MKNFKLYTPEKYITADYAKAGEGIYKNAGGDSLSGT